MKKVYLIALLSLTISGCNDYPGHRPSDGIKMVDKPAWGESISQEISLGGDCHIDSINDELGEGPLSHTIKKNETGLKISGWSAISVSKGVTASDIAIALKSKSTDGTRLFAIITRDKRPDVAAYFKNLASVDTGFKTTIDLSDVSPGSYILEVIQHKDGKSFKCPVTANVIVED